MSRAVVSRCGWSGKKKDPSRVFGSSGYGLSCAAQVSARSRPARAPGPPARVRGRSHRPHDRRACFNPQAVPIPDLLRELLRAAGPSGHEEPAAAVWREAAAAFAEVTSDTLGTSFARVAAGATARRRSL